MGRLRGQLGVSHETHGADTIIEIHENRTAFRHRFPTVQRDSTRTDRVATALDEYDDRQIREALKRSFPPINTELGRDLWPAVLRKLDTRPARVPWYDWALIGLGASVLLFFPELIFVLAYHF